MSEPQFTDPPDEALAADPAMMAGAQLRAAREAHGLSIDAVAQHLKLAPRQVKALEDNDFGQLPGRTFVRGFARNYARLMHLDPEAILAALPGTAAPALDKPVIGSSTRPMGELPPSQHRRTIAWSRWAIVLAIAALIGVAAIYEVTRNAAPRSAERVPAKQAVVDPIGPLTSAGTPLPNPLAGSDTASPQAPASESSGAASAMLRATGDPAALPGPITPAMPSLPITNAASPMAVSSPSSAAAEGTLIISYRGPAWTEVRDANGQRLLLVTGAPGTSETVSGTPPLEVTLGNAAQVSVTWRGTAFDLAPHIKGSVARARLP